MSRTAATARVFEIGKHGLLSAVEDVELLESGEEAAAAWSFNVHYLGTHVGESHRRTVLVPDLRVR